MARNQYIYALADYGLVVQSERGTGGTWAGATENLRERWVPLLVRESAEASGNRDLIQRGGLRFSSSAETHGSLREYLSGLRRDDVTASVDLDSAKSDLFVPKEVPHGGEPVASEVGELTQPLLAGVNPEGEAHHAASRLSTLDMFPEFSRRIRSLLAAGPKSEKEIQESMGLEPGQAKAWLRKAEQEHVIVRTERPVRFALAHEGQLF
jgi:predicted Rossmann fold nucleotide-binding protein DprA/Smf involved in DNA uptake